MEQENREYLLSLTPSERLNYAVIKYFNSQTEFAEKVGLKTQLINKYCNGKTAKIPIANLMQIEEKVYISSQFILTGAGAEFVDGKILPPVRKIKQLPTQEITDKVKESKLKRGECNQIILNRSGRAMTTTETGVINIIETAFDNLKNPVLLHIVDPVFCNKYKFKVAV